MKKHIFLNGFMGAGKSKIGPVLAGRLACPFYDSDRMIEQQAGKKVSDIFQQDGEAEFRKWESRVIERLAAEKVKSVIALGGGALLSEKNRAQARQSGIIIYVKSSPHKILERVKDSKKRPLLNIPKDKNFEDNLLKMIKDLLTKRQEIYESADLIFERDDFEYQEAAEHLYQEIIKYEKH
jgi:shikimate kinase